ncbi:DinB family protein [uncultured Jatrophihabitans sp.]|uniref:DinB family protein n=1 Tax=uncultured Jatrophihabitans sp. TaxID=1610747 RepID=UPI0035CA5CAC
MDAWTVPAPHPLDGPLTGDDRPMLEAYLDWERNTLHKICAGLTGEQLARRPIATTTLSLQGLLRHMAKVERTWFRIRVPASDLPPLFDPDRGNQDFEAIDPEHAAEDLDLWLTESRLAVDAVRELPFDHILSHHGEPMSLRMVHLHMIGEYARHNGHADLLREAIDGVTAR